ncbi:unnamed protein product [Porites evermanni]|uniref:Uncharacterized protein n=1 Tax=Porites evermanni TaxID=104178 RepID=A0ABN8LIU1_9CNID|nr:unnamed protein product [Porites evermanni]
MPLSNGKHLLPNDPPKKGRLFEIRRLKGRTSFRPCTRVLTKVPFLPMERRNICLSRPPIWAKFSFQIFLKLLKPAACLSAKERGVKSQHSLILHLLHGAGFTINWEKSVLELTQSLTFLDFSINSLMMSFSLPEEKS